MESILRCEKLKFDIDVNNDDTNPGPPVGSEVAMYGINDSPSYKTEDTFPKEDDAIEPVSINMRSCSMTPFASCVSCRGTNAN